MPWLSKVVVQHHFKAPDFEVDLTPDPGEDFKHLIFTGPNGSGKTTIVRAISRTIEQWLGHPYHGKQFHVGLNWTPSPDTHELSVGARFQAGTFVCAALSMQRNLGVEAVAGPTLLTHKASLPHLELAPKFLAYLVNQQVQARLAQHDDPAAAEAIFRWFADLERALAELFSVPGLKLKFLRETYDIKFVEPSGLTYGFSELPSGYASVLRILAELVLRIDALGSRLSPDLSGVVIIDEIDAFLHPSLQERILPFLTRAYPRLQFIVATHSPAVATSLSNAMVVALGTGRSCRADSLVGTPFGVLLTSLFGLETDVDLKTTDEIHELDRLATLAQRTPAEDARLAELAESLQQSGNARALEVWLSLQLKATA